MSYFPQNPFEIIDPSERWVPSDNADLFGGAYEQLLPPLVHKIRKEVKEWRDSGYKDASQTSKDLLEFWFQKKHWKEKDSERKEFQYFFAQREAMESIIYLYEVAGALDKFELLKFDSSGRISTGMFPENWASYIIKMATGSGKTKVASLVLVWSYFHKIYEPDSPLSTNFLIIAPNIIVLDRLKKDFANSEIFREDPLVPEDGYKDKDWKKDFQLTIHIQDNIGAISPKGNIFLTNKHRIGVSENNQPSYEDNDLTEYFLGPKPPTKADRKEGVDLGELLRNNEIKDLVVINDEAHGVRGSGQDTTKWFENIRDINNQMKLEDSKGISLQVGFTATPKHQDGGIFPQTICDYPLVEAIRQNVVKTPVLPDQASRARLREKETDDYVKRYQDYIQLGYEEWKKQYKELKSSGKIPKLFVMTTTTKEADAVKKHLEDFYSEFKGAVLVIHTNQSGEVVESKANEKTLQELRRAADDIDNPESPYKVIVSVLMLREGWDVQTVSTVVGLRPFTHTARILPEQTIGRGIRKMFGFDVKNEELAIIGTDPFVDFVKSISREGVEFGYRSMGREAPSKNPIVVEPDKENKKKNLENLDINIPRLTPRVYKEYKRLDEIDIEKLEFETCNIKQFSPDQQREIVFEDLEGKESHRILLDEVTPDYRSVIRFFANTILQETRLFSGFEELYPKIEKFIQFKLFEKEIDLSDLNVLRNLSRIEVKNTIIHTFRDAINKLTVTDRGGAEIKNYIKLRDTKPQVFSRQEYLSPEKSVFNKIVGDSNFELEMATFLDNVTDIISFAKNTYNIHFKIEYVGEDGNIHPYYPDFLVKKDNRSIYVVETKGREGLDDRRKIDQLIIWCQDANLNQDNFKYYPVYIKQEEWEKYKKDIKKFEDIINTFLVKKQYATR